MASPANTGLSMTAKGRGEDIFASGNTGRGSMRPPTVVLSGTTSERRRLLDRLFDRRGVRRDVRLCGGPVRSALDLLTYDGFSANNHAV